jgi:hypothetical protein
MSFAVRSGARAATKAALKGSARVNVARAFTAGARLSHEVVAEKTVPVSNYGGSAASKFEIPVQKSDVSKVVSLTQSAYSNMTRTMQSMSLMDKNVLVTG